MKEILFTVLFLSIIILIHNQTSKSSQISANITPLNLKSPELSLNKIPNFETTSWNLNPISNFASFINPVSKYETPSYEMPPSWSVCKL